MNPGEQAFRWLEEQPGYIGHFPPISTSGLTVICDRRMTREIRDKVRREFAGVEFRMVEDDDLKQR